MLDRRLNRSAICVRAVYRCNCVGASYWASRDSGFGCRSYHCLGKLLALTTHLSPAINLY